ncbi:MAG: DUF4199 domain-containing protein [Bacteroidales bacterium]
MTEEKNKINRFAMEYGLILSAYFILKFGATVFSTRFTLLSIPAWGMLLGIPFVLYWMLRIFRNRQNGGYIEFGKAWSISMLLIFFASLPEALVQYCYFEFINPAYIQEQITHLSATIETMGDLKESPAIAELINNYKTASTPSAIQMAFQGIFNNLFFGGLLSLAVAAVIKRNAPTGGNAL